MTDEELLKTAIRAMCMDVVGSVFDALHDRIDAIERVLNMREEETNRRHHVEASER